MSNDIGRLDLESYRAMSRSERRAAFRAAGSNDDRQALLVLGIALHSTAAGAEQQDLVEPLTAADLAAGEGYTPAITSVDSTPRPRYGESRAKFEARMAGYRRDVDIVRADVARRNRALALHVVLDTGQVAKWADVEHEVEAGRLAVASYFARCACGLTGLRVGDPEVARREYDAHACRADSIGQDAVDRAQACADKPTIAKRLAPAVLVPAVAEVADAVTTTDERTVVATASLDDAEQRFALLELGQPRR